MGRLKNFCEIKNKNLNIYFDENIVCKVARGPFH